MKKLILIIILLSSTIYGQRNHFGYEIPDQYTLIDLQIDPGGSLDKKGINGVIGFAVRDYSFLEYNFRSQMIFTNKYVNDGTLQLDYIDAMVGVGIVIPIFGTVESTWGLHGGLLYRPKGVDGVSHHAGMMWGLENSFRWWTSDKFSIMGSFTYDYREFKEFRLNGRIGIGYILCN